MNERILRGSIALVSVAVFGLLLWVLYGHEAADAHGGAAALLPLVNATSNFLCVLCLVAGYRAIRAGRRRQHVAWMLAAVTCSAVFLVGYVAHHFSAGDTPFGGRGPVRLVYFAILISHVVVTTVTLPMILLTLAYASASRFSDHKRIARRTLPLWLYVSVTGVLVFLFLRWWA